MGGESLVSIISFLTNDDTTIVDSSPLAVQISNFKDLLPLDWAPDPDWPILRGPPSYVSNSNELSRDVTLTETDVATFSVQEFLEFSGCPRDFEAKHLLNECSQPLLLDQTLRQSQEDEGSSAEAHLSTVSEALPNTVHPTMNCSGMRIVSDTSFMPDSSQISQSISSHRVKSPHDGPISPVVELETIVNNPNLPILIQNDGSTAFRWTDMFWNRPAISHSLPQPPHWTHFMLSEGMKGRQAEACLAASDTFPTDVDKSRSSQFNPRRRARRGGNWKPAEEEACIALMRTYQSKPTRSKNGAFWREISESLSTQGYNRTPVAIKNRWTRVLRERSGIDERKWR